MHWQFIRAVWASVADTAIVPAQDLLGLGSEARMNRPGTDADNWRWRLTPGQLTPASPPGSRNSPVPTIASDTFVLSAGHLVQDGSHLEQKSGAFWTI